MKPAITILSEAALRQCVPLDEAAIDCVERAFIALAGGEVVMPPILSMDIKAHNGEVDVKTAWLPGFDSFAIKISPGFFDNPARGLPSTSGLMTLFSSTTGLLEAVLLDNGYLTDVRTAAAGAVAARHLAPRTASHACIIGAGTQAALQLEALCLVRPIRHASLWARDRDKAAVLAKKLANRLGIDITVADDRRSAVAQADIIVTTTPAHRPLIEPDWLHAGQHVTAMGSDQPHKNELHPDCLARADLYIADRRAQTEVLGELHHAIRGGLPDTLDQSELADWVVPHSTKRRAEDAISICDLTGTGAQDTAIATLAFQRAREQELGALFDTGEP